MDANKNRPGDEDYDETSLHIPAKFWSGLEAFSPTMAQYWEIKRFNMDKIVLFNLNCGKNTQNYQIFYEDAIYCQKALDLNWIKPPGYKLPYL